jgi:hypothetical protein
MNISAIITLLAALGALILGWKPVTKMIGPTKFKMGDNSVLGIFVLFGSVFHLSLKIVLSIALGYILFIFTIIKFIINRIKLKNTDMNKTQSSSDDMTN